MRTFVTWTARRLQNQKRLKANVYCVERSRSSASCSSALISLEKPEGWPDSQERVARKRQPASVVYFLAIEEASVRSWSWSSELARLEGF